jgi:carbamoyltransferase
MYSDVSVVLGFGKNGEGKTMGLSSYGLPTYDFSTAFLFTSFNNYTLDRQKLLSCIDHIRSMNSEPDFSQDQKNLAASIQSSMEDAVVTLAREAFRLSGIENFVLVGGVALNCKANERLLNQSFCKSLYVPPVPNDSGNALGSALYGAHISGYTVRSSLHHAYWGPSYSNDEVEDELRKADLFYHKYDSIIEEAAQLISTGKVIGWFQGRMEIGPRALGNRSILADPTRRGINDRVNQIKMRDKWRPFAPAVTADDAGRYFLGFDKIQSSPFMSFSMKLRESFQEDLPAVTHIDGRCRVQTVALEQNPSFFSLLKAMERRNGHPMLLNTSFNIGNEPIVCTPTQAISSFCCSDLDALVMGNFLVLKKILYGKIHGDCILS